MCSGEPGDADASARGNEDDAPVIAVLLDGSIAMRGVATVLTEAGLAPVREYAGSGRTPAELLAATGDLPEVVVVNLGEAGQWGLTEEFRPLFARHRVVGFCPSLEQPDVAALLEAGVRGCVTWNADPAALVDAVRTVTRLGFYVPPSPASEPRPAVEAPAAGVDETSVDPAATVEQSPQAPEPAQFAGLPGALGLPAVLGGSAIMKPAGRTDPAVDSAGRLDRRGVTTLTMRERQVLTSVSTGLTHKEIARLLGLSKTTVDTYVQRIRQKLGVGNKAELVRAAYRFGLCVDD
jgi:DNA-binding NarL/FixJ family response regulator